MKAKLSTLLKIGSRRIIYCKYRFFVATCHGNLPAKTSIFQNDVVRCNVLHILLCEANVCKFMSIFLVVKPSINGKMSIFWCVTGISTSCSSISDALQECNWYCNFSWAEYPKHWKLIPNQRTFVRVHTLPKVEKFPYLKLLKVFSKKL